MREVVYEVRLEVPDNYEDDHDLPTEREMLRMVTNGLAAKHAHLTEVGVDVERMTARVTS